MPGIPSARLPVDWMGDCCESPHPQVRIALRSRWLIETCDSTRWSGRRVPGWHEEHSENLLLHATAFINGDAVDARLKVEYEV